MAEEIKQREYAIAEVEREVKKVKKKITMMIMQEKHELKELAKSKLEEMEQVKESHEQTITTLNENIASFFYLFSAAPLQFNYDIALFKAAMQN